MMPKGQFVSPYIEEDHNLLKDVSDNVIALRTEYHTAHAALVERVDILQDCIQGKNRDDGLVTKVESHNTTIRNFGWLLVIVLPIMSGGIGWLIVNAINVAAALARIK
jgi:hypothetical protein